MFSFKKLLVLLSALFFLFSGNVFARKTILLKENLVREIIAEVSGVLQKNNIMRLAPYEMERIFAGINIDMVGEHLVKARSIFYVSRSSWAMPSFFNDVVQDFAELTREMNNNDSTIDYGKLALRITSPAGGQYPFLMDIYGYDSGSDHVQFPFFAAGPMIFTTAAWILPINPTPPS